MTATIDATMTPTMFRATTVATKKKPEYHTRTIRVDNNIYEMLELMAPLLGKRSVTELATDLLRDALEPQIQKAQQLLKSKTDELKKNR